MDVKIVAWVVIAACSSSKPHTIEDARSVQPPVRDAAVPYKPEVPAAKGDVQIRVEWHDVPAIARASAGRTACGTPRAPDVAPTTTWGIPDVFVMIDVDHGKAMVDPNARVVLEHCALSPRAIVAGGSITIASAAERPSLSSRSRFWASIGGAALTDKPRAIALPITGHEVTAELAPGSQYVLSIGGTDPETAWIYAATTPYAGVTEASGQIVIRDVPVGTQRVTAWLPPRANQPARLAHGTATVTVTAGSLAEVTLDLHESMTWIVPIELEEAVRAAAQDVVGEGPLVGAALARAHRRSIAALHERTRSPRDARRSGR